MSELEKGKAFRAPLQSIPMIWDLLYEFRDCCEGKNWGTYSIGDLVRAEDGFHKFFWIRGLYPSTFQSIISSPSCALVEGSSYRMVPLEYMAWVLPVPPPTSIWLYVINEAPKVSQRVALYDLSPIYEGARTAIKLNETDSVVFQEFEHFLYEKYGISFRSLTKVRP